MTTRKELILLHAHNTIQPGSTASWLEKRPWIHSHYHVFMKMSAILQSPPKKQNTLLNLKHHFENYYRESAPKSKTSSSRSDFSRIARRLLSQTIGVALGGGGARGIAHIGVLRAFEEAGIPIDIICGTSMGAFVGALYAKDNTQLSIHGRAKMLCSRIVSPWRNLLDLTYPITSMFTGHELNRAIWKCFSDSQIQDCWIPYFATSTNITWSKLNIHTSGYIWRYVRASMSLSGLVPPLCDKGDLLMDGGYLNNLPADQLRKMGVNSIIAIDVGK
jgi:lysophospholipid hydrolase